MGTKSILVMAVPHSRGARGDSPSQNWCSVSVLVVWLQTSAPTSLDLPGPPHQVCKTGSKADPAGEVFGSSKGAAYKRRVGGRDSEDFRTPSSIVLQRSATWEQ